MIGEVPRASTEKMEKKGRKSFYWGGGGAGGGEFEDEKDRGEINLLEWCIALVLKFHAMKNLHKGEQK